MADSYTALRAKLPPEQQKTLLADQRRWITRRTAACVTNRTTRSRNAARRNRGAAAFLGRRKRERRPRRAAHCADPVPRGAARAATRFSIETPQMLTRAARRRPPSSKAARAIAFGKNAVKEYREMERPMAKGAEKLLRGDLRTSAMPIRS